MGYNWDYLDTEAYNNRTGHYKFQTQFDFVIKHLRLDTIHVLDVAGGSGRFAIPLMSLTEKVTVVDINASAIEILKARNSEISTMCADFMETNFSESYSSIICIEAIGYFPDIKKVCIKMNKLLDMHGNIIFTYTNTGSWRFLLRKIKSWFGGTTTYNELNFKELKKILCDCNFEIEAVAGMNWIPLPLNSNSILVGIFVFLEKKLNLKHWQSQSPWLLISAKKIADL